MLAEPSHGAIINNITLSDPKTVSHRWVQMNIGQASSLVDNSFPIYKIKRNGLAIPDSNDLEVFCDCNRVFEIRWRSAEQFLRIIIGDQFAILQILNLSTKKKYSNIVFACRFIPNTLKEFVTIIIDDSIKSLDVEEYEPEIEELYDSDYKLMFSNTNDCFVGSYRPSLFASGEYSCPIEV